jgi:hypothetical protein
MIAGAHEQRAQDEKGDGRREEKNIEHGRSPKNAWNINSPEDR